MAKASGTGAANDAAVDTTPTAAGPDPIQAADAAVAACEAKVERQRQHLAGAEQALAQAIAARKELG